MLVFVRCEQRGHAAIGFGDDPELVAPQFVGTQDATAMLHGIVIGSLVLRAEVAPVLIRVPLKTAHQEIFGELIGSASLDDARSECANTFVCYWCDACRIFHRFAHATSRTDFRLVVAAGKRGMIRERISAAGTLLGLVFKELGKLIQKIVHCLVQSFFKLSVRCVVVVVHL